MPNMNTAHRRKKNRNNKYIAIISFFILIGCVFVIYIYHLNDADFDFTSITSVTTIDGGQDGAIYNGYIFTFDALGVCKVYSVADYSQIDSFTLDKADIIPPHSNSVCFGSTYYNDGDAYPLLYSNIYNNDPTMPGVVNVYRLVQNGTMFSSTLVQIIKISFTNGEQWGSGVRPYGNFVVYTDNDDLWAFVMDDMTHTTKFFSFDIPGLEQGIYSSKYGCRVVNLEYIDVKQTFSTSRFNFIQGCCYYNGRLYSCEGFTDDATNIPAIRVVDLKKGVLETTINLPSELGLILEPEFLSVYEDLLYYKDISGNLYYFRAN